MALVVIGICIVEAAALAFWLFLENRKLRTRYGKIVDVEAEVDRAKRDLERLRGEQSNEEGAFKQKREELRTGYEAAKAVYDRLSSEVRLLEENIEDISIGLYKPHFDYASSEDYKAKLTSVRDREKDLIKNSRAVTFGVAWTIGNSRKEGERMQKQYAKLLLRAFNGECDAGVANVAWNNVTKMEERIRKAFEVINGLGGVMQISINTEYLNLKIDELHLEYELEDKKHKEQEEQREIRERMREEEKAQRDREKALKEATEEEARQQRALEKARAELAKAKGEEVGALNDRIKLLEVRLTEAQQKAERTKSMAEQTRSGYVYVISNIGSFGETMFKIGMTRRLDPMDRVHELGDASVPFSFDVHAMVYCQDAPSVENMLHKAFAQQRVNLVNNRKEFFHVNIDEVQEFATKNGLQMELTRIAEARQYRETVAIRNGSSKQQPVGAVAGAPVPVHMPFPSTI